MLFLTLGEVATRLRVSSTTVRRLVGTGELRAVYPSRQRPRVTDEELERWARRTAPAEKQTPAAPKHQASPADLAEGRVDLVKVARELTGIGSGRSSSGGLSPKIPGGTSSRSRRASSAGARSSKSSGT